jgi:hypothetical protein
MTAYDYFHEMVMAKEKHEAQMAELEKMNVKSLD